MTDDRTLTNVQHQMYKQRQKIANTLAVVIVENKLRGSSRDTTKAQIKTAKREQLEASNEHT